MALTGYNRNDIEQFVTADSNPGASDDIYPIGTRWYNSDNNRLYTCLDNTENNAVWRYVATS